MPSPTCRDPARRFPKGDAAIGGNQRVVADVSPSRVVRKGFFMVFRVAHEDFSDDLVIPPSLMGLKSRIYAAASTFWQKRAESGLSLWKQSNILVLGNRTSEQASKRRLQLSDKGHMEAQAAVVSRRGNRAA